MESADLRIFRAVAYEGSVTKAAARLGYVQSNVTARILQLESELGAPLFIRHNRGMSLSASGKTLLAYADKIVGLLEEAAQALSSTGAPRGKLSIGSTQTAAAVRLPPMLAEYYRQYADVQLSLTTGHTQELIDRVLQYELDGAFVGCSLHHPDLAYRAVFDEELVVVAPPDVSGLQDAIRRPILVYSTGCTYRAVLEQWLQSERSPMPAVMEFGTLEAILGGVSAGLGISLLPRAVIDKLEAARNVRAFTLPDSFNRMPTGFITRRDAYVTGPLRAFMAMLPAP